MSSSKRLQAGSVRRPVLLSKAPPVAAPPLGATSSSRPKKVMVARKLAPGQTRVLPSGEVTMPALTTQRGASVQTIPVSLATADQTNLSPTNILGSVDDYNMVKDLLSSDKPFENKDMAAPVAPISEEQEAADGFQRFRMESIAHEAAVLESSLQHYNFGDRLHMTKDERVLNRWKAMNESWAKFKEKTAQKLGTSPDSLMISRAEEYRERVEMNLLLAASTPIHEKYLEKYWELTLRGETGMYFRVGNQFTALWCKVPEDRAPQSQIIRPSPVSPPSSTSARGGRSGRRVLGREKTAPLSWKNSAYLAQRKNQLSARLEQLRKDISGEVRLDDLVVQGTDLFAPDSDDEEEEEEEEEDGGSMMGEQAQVDGGDVAYAAAIDRERRVVPQAVQGPALHLSANRLLFEGAPGRTVCNRVQLTNTGSTCVYFEWEVEKGIVGEGAQADCFQTVAHTGTLLPGASVFCSFSFCPPTPGLYGKTMTLSTTPRLLPSSTDSFALSLVLRGVSGTSDEGVVFRQELQQELAAAATEGAALVQQRREAEVAALPKLPPSSEYERLFYAQNRAEKLFYFPSVCAGFLELAQDTLACHPLSVRLRTVWDFSVASLLSLIRSIPSCNASFRAPLEERWTALCQACRDRPAPNPYSYMLMHALLSRAIGQLPRLSHACHQHFKVPAPVKVVAPGPNLEEMSYYERQEYEMGVAEAETAKAEAYEKLSEEEKAEKASRQAQSDAAKQQYEEERNELLSKVSDQLHIQVRGILTQTIDQFVTLQSSLSSEQQYGEQESLPSAAELYLESVEQEESRAPFLMSRWGSYFPAEEVADSAQSGGDKKNKKEGSGAGRVSVLKRPKSGGGQGRATGGQQGGEDKVLNKGGSGSCVPLATAQELGRLVDKWVVQVSLGLCQGLALTKDDCVFRWDVPAADGTGGHGKHSHKKTSTKMDDGKKTSTKGSSALNLLGKEEENDVYDWMPVNNKEGGSSVSSSIDLQPVSIPALQGLGLVSVAAGGLSGGCLGVTREGHVVSWNSKDACDLKVVLLGQEVTQCALGKGELPICVALNKQGKVFSWGDLGKYSAILGHGDNPKDKKPHLLPELVPAFTHVPVQEVQVGGGHVLALAKGGTEVWAWGDGPQCGFGGKKVSHYIPEMIANFPPNASVDPVISIACGLSHSIALTKDGWIYTWGKGAQGQLGLGDLKDRDRPTLLLVYTEGSSEQVEREKEAAEGGAKKKGGGSTKEGGSAGSARPGSTRGREGEKEIESFSPEQLAVLVRFFSIAAGDYHSLALARPVPLPPLTPEEQEAAELASFGGGGGYGMGDEDKRPQPRVEGYAWGSNEMGELGAGHTRDLLVPTLIEGMHPKPIVDPMAAFYHEVVQEEPCVPVAVVAGGRSSASVCLHPAYLKQEEEKVLLKNQLVQNNAARLKLKQQLLDSKQQAGEEEEEEEEEQPSSRPALAFQRLQSSPGTSFVAASDEDEEQMGENDDGMEEEEEEVEEEEEEDGRNYMIDDDEVEEEL